MDALSRLLFFSHCNNDQENVPQQFEKDNNLEWCCKANHHYESKT